MRYEYHDKRHFKDKRQKIGDERGDKRDVYAK